VDTIRAQASAWALGDVEKLRQLPNPRAIEACTAAVATSGQMAAFIAQATESWNAAVEEALTGKRTWLAIRSIYDLLGAQGTLAALRAKGYRVEGL
jgi:hypothetical protein